MAVLSLCVLGVILLFLLCDIETVKMICTYDCIPAINGAIKITSQL